MSASFSLYIDAGNSRIKWRSETEEGATPWTLNTPISSPWPDSHSGAKALVASVRSQSENAHLVQALEASGYGASFAEVMPAQDGLSCGYKDPSQLGIDRWMALLAGWRMLRSGFVLVSAGTALTLDSVDQTGKHLGGYIVAGMGLGRTALLDLPGPDQ